MTKTYIILSLFLLTACGSSASATKTYTAEGMVGYAINCSGVERHWGMCYEKAGDKCEKNGYDILDVIGEAGTTTAVKATKEVSTTDTTVTHNRTMIIQCKPPKPPEIKPTSVPAQTPPTPTPAAIPPK